MKLYKDTDIDNAKRTMDIYIADAGTDIRKHPSYIEFVRNLSEKIGEADAESFWNLMMKGFRKMYSDRDPSGFQDFAEKVGKKGLLSTGSEEMALWTGGYEMSQLARKLKYCTLEKTVIGSLLDTTIITSLWNLEEELWNAISRKFVEGYDKYVAHVYFRTLNDLSVLLKQEVPQLKAKKVAVHWHPIYNNGLKQKELTERLSEVGTTGDAINILSNNSGFGSLEEAGKALSDKLKTVNPQINQQAKESANSRFLKPNQPPFATDDDA